MTSGIFWNFLSPLLNTLSQMASAKEQIFNRTRVSRQKETEESIFLRTFARFHHFTSQLFLKVSALKIGDVETISDIVENSRKNPIFIRSLLETVDLHFLSFKE